MVNSPIIAKRKMEGGAGKRKREEKNKKERRTREEKGTGKQNG